MAGIKDYSTTAASNNSAVPNGWPEGMAPSGVNNSARQNMADLRSWYEDAQWTNLGHTCTQTGATTFTIAADVTADYVAGRAIRIVDSSTLYRTIVSASYSSPNTTITVDSGTLTSTMDGQTVSLGTITPTNDAFPRTYIHEQTALASLTASDALLFADSRSTGLANLHKKVLWSSITGLFATVTDAVLAVTGSATQSARIRLPEDTDNGANYMEIAAPASVTSNTTLTLPDGAGSANQVLEDTDGAGTLGWVTPSTADTVKITTTTASSDATIEFTSLDTATYTNFFVIINNMTPATNATDLYFRVGTGATPTWQSGATDYSWVKYYMPTSWQSTYDVSDNQIDMSSNAQMSNNANCSYSGTIWIHAPAASRYTVVNGVFAHMPSYDTTAIIGGNYHGQFKSTTAVTGIQFLMSSGNISVGDFTLYGVK